MTLIEFLLRKNNLQNRELEIVKNTLREIIPQVVKAEV
jgi:hypothetical protein